MRKSYLKNKIKKIILISRYFLLLLVPASASAQDVDCCLHITAQPDNSNPLLITFCISACDVEYQFFSTWNFGDGSPVIPLTTDTCVSHQYPPVTVKGEVFTVCLSSDMCTGDSLITGMGCVYDTCFNMTINISNTGIPELSGFNMDIFPNPVSDFIHVNSTSQISHVELLNVTGEKMLELKAKNSNTTDMKIPIHNFPSGIYYLKIVSPDNKVLSKKVQIINK